MKIIFSILILFSLLPNCSPSWEQRAIKMHQRALTLHKTEQYRAEVTACSLFSFAATLAPTGLSASAQGCFFDAAMFCLDYEMKRETIDPATLARAYSMVDKICLGGDSASNHMYEQKVRDFSETLLTNGYFYSAIDAAEKAFVISRDSNKSATLNSFTDRVTALLTNKVESLFDSGVLNHDTLALIQSEFYLQMISRCNRQAPKSLEHTIYKHNRSLFSDYINAFTSTPDPILWQTIQFSKSFLAIDTLLSTRSTLTITCRIKNNNESTIDITKGSFFIFTENGEMIPAASVKQTIREIPPKETGTAIVEVHVQDKPEALIFDHKVAYLAKRIQ